MITIEDFSATKTLNFQFLPELNVIFYMIVGLQYTVVFSMASMTRIIVFHIESDEIDDNNFTTIMQHLIL
jgi:hypothetical protein